MNGSDREVSFTVEAASDQHSPKRLLTRQEAADNLSVSFSKMRRLTIGDIEEEQ